MTAREAPLPMAVVTRIATTTLRGWTTGMGVSRELAWPFVAGAFALALASSIIGAAWLAGSGLLDELTHPRVAVLVLVALVWVSAFTGIFAAAAAASATGSIRFLRTLPLTDRALGAALAAPTLAAALLQASFLAPALALVVARGLGLGYAQGLAFALLANVLGALHGRMLYGLARHRAIRRGGAGLPPQLVAVSGLALSVVLGELILATQWGPAPHPGIALLAAPLGWPGLVAFAVRGDALSALALLAALAFGIGMEVRAWPWITAVVDLRPSGRAALGRWRPGPGSLTRLQVLRMLRNERVRNLLGAMLVLEALSALLLVTADPEVRAGVLDNAILLWILTAAGLSVVARGISARHRPFALTLGFPPWRWGTSVALGALALGGAAVAPALASVAYVERSWWLALGGLGELLFVTAAGATLGAIATPNPGTGPMETLALGLVLGADLVAGNLVDRLTPISSAAGIGLVLGLLGMPLLAAPGLVEIWRWRRDLGLPVSPWSAAPRPESGRGPAGPG